MAVTAKQAAVTPAAAAPTRTAEYLTAAILLLTAIAAAVGLFIPDFYRDTAWVVPQNRGTDLLTLAGALPALALTLLAVRRGSQKARIIWLGLLGYVLYIYIGATMAYAFNNLYLVYVALFSLCIFALILAGTTIDADAIRERFDSGTPHRSVAAFLLLMAVMLTVAYLGQIVPFFLTGEVPEIVTLAGGPTFFVWALDLGLIVPLSVLGAIWLLQRRAWGYILAGCMLIKAATMGMALLAMTWFSVVAGIEADIAIAGLWVMIATGGLGLSIWFFRHCRG